MSSFLDMISAFIAFLLAAAFLHFGASDDSVVRDSSAPAPVVAQSHSESTMSPETVAVPQDAQPVAAEAPAGHHRT